MSPSRDIREHLKAIRRKVEHLLDDPVGGEVLQQIQKLSRKADKLEAELQERDRDG